MTTRNPVFRDCFALSCSASGLAPGWWPTTSGSRPALSAARAAPTSSQFVPRDASVVAYADVHEIMTSELRQKVRRALPMQENGQREFEDPDRHQHRNRHRPRRRLPRIPIATARTTGRRHGARARPVRRGENRSADARARRAASRPTTASGWSSDHRSATGSRRRPAVSDARLGHSFAVSFIEPGLVAHRQHAADPVRDRPASRRQQSAAGPRKRHRQRRADEPGALARRGNAWAVGRFDALGSHARLPDAVSSQIPAITWFSVSGHVNGGIRGIVRAEARDDEAANNLRDVVRGFLALAKLQTGAQAGAAD